MTKKWEMVYCGLCDYKAYSNHPKRRLRQHLYSKHGTKEEIKKIRNDILDLKACSRAMQLIGDKPQCN